MKRPFIHLEIDWLEERCLLAANLSAVFSGGNLTIRGQAGDFKITPGSQSGTFVVTGLDGTTINHKKSATFFGAIQDLNVNLGSGSGHTIKILGISIQDDLNIVTGHLADVVKLCNVRVGDDTSITTSGGNDAVNIGTCGGCQFGDDFFAGLGNGNDVIRAASSLVQDDATVDGGGGFNTAVNLGGNFVGGSLTLLNIQQIKTS